MVLRLGEVEILGEQPIYSGRKVSLKKLLLRIRGKETFHEVIDFGQSVAILPFISDGEVILIKQFRGPLRGWILEIPAGKIDEGEDPEDTCVRELIEEIGYRPNRLEKLASCYLSPGYSNELIHVFVARDLVYVGQKLEEHEAIHVVRMGYGELLRMVLDGNIVDAKTVIAVSLYELKKRG